MTAAADGYRNGEDAAPAVADRVPSRSDAETRGQGVRRRRFSPITLRILAVNILALAILVAGLLYLGEYRRGLVAASLDSLKVQADLIAGAVAEGAVRSDPQVERALEQVVAQQMVRRLTEAGRVRARLFDTAGRMVADSRELVGASRSVIVEELPPPDQDSWIERALSRLYEGFAAWLAGSERLPPYIETPVPLARDYTEVVKALNGEYANALRVDSEGHMILSVAVPVQRYKRVLGALMLTSDSSEIEAAVRAVRLDILKVFALALAITVVLSIYLAGTIAQPIRRLASAADRMRRTKSRQVEIPDFTAREDEIGDLSKALRDMTEALWRRMDGIERFAADVAHEIKNPLSSLRSAVETATRIKDPEQQRRLMEIIEEDVARLDRLITDISNASRLDSELSRTAAERLDIANMLQTLVNIHDHTTEHGPPLALAVERGDLDVEGQEGQLVQVFRNLIENALSFCLRDGTIHLSARRENDNVVVEFADDGPGIPPGKEEAIFERFYSERPEGEKFGTHSGLGLSISRQIVEAHGGTLIARNRVRGGRVVGAVFVVTLPAASPRARS